MSLGGILDHAETMQIGKIEHRLHIYRMAVQMDWDDSTSARSENLFKLSPVHRIGFWINIDKDWRSTHQRNGLHSRDKGV